MCNRLAPEIWAIRLNIYFNWILHTHITSYQPKEPAWNISMHDQRSLLNPTALWKLLTELASHHSYNVRYQAQSFHQAQRQPLTTIVRVDYHLCYTYNYNAPNPLWGIDDDKCIDNFLQCWEFIQWSVVWLCVTRIYGAELEPGSTVNRTIQTVQHPTTYYWREAALIHNTTTGWCW